MSQKSKDTTIEKSVEKIKAILDKNDMDEALKIWWELKTYMNARVNQQAESLQSKASELANAAERL